VKKNSKPSNIQGNFLTTIFDLSKNDILRDLIMMHKCRVFLTVVEKIHKWSR
jgi:hypothetical protein